MTWIDQRKQLLLPGDDCDESLYTLVAKEASAGRIRPGLWTKALAESDFDERRARALYLRLRVAQLKRIFPKAAELVKQFEKSREELERVTRERASEETEVSRLQKDLENSSRELAVLMGQIEPLLPLARLRTRSVAFAGLLSACMGGLLGWLVEPWLSMGVSSVPAIVAGLPCGLLAGTLWAGRDEESRAKLQLLNRLRDSALLVQKKVDDARVKLDYAQGRITSLLQANDAAEKSVFRLESELRAIVG